MSCCSCAVAVSVGLAAAIHPTEHSATPQVIPIPNPLLILPPNLNLYLFQVRCGVLDKEVAELRDEVTTLQTRLAAYDEQAVRDFVTKARRTNSQHSIQPTA